MFIYNLVLALNHFFPKFTDHDTEKIIFMSELADPSPSQHC